MATGAGIHRVSPGRAVAGFLVLAGGLVLVAAARVLAFGWSSVEPDDARYLFVGLSILDGQGPLNPNGTVFLLRSPVYGLALAAGSTLVGGDPLVGARIVAIALALLGLAGAVRLGWLLAGPGGAVGTAIALVATPLVWQLVPSLRIDLPQTAAIVAALIALWRPTARRWAVGGVLIGIAILVKETALPLLLLPIVLIGVAARPRIVRLAATFLGAAVVTVGWWWAFVWLASGQVFPFNALSVTEERDVSAPLVLARTAVPLLAVMAMGWCLVAWRARSTLGPRILLAGALGLAPGALYAASVGLNARSFAGLAVLSAIAVGAGGAWLVADLRSRRAARPAVPGRGGALAALVAVAVFALAAPVVGQRDAVRPTPDRLSDELAGWLQTNVPEGGRVAMPFREREATALRGFGRLEVANLPIQRVGGGDPPETYLWMGLRDEQLFGYLRSSWIAALTEPAATYLVLVGPHPFTPVDLVGARVGGPSLPGLVPVATLDDGRSRADILGVDAGAVRMQTPLVPLHVSAAAASAWLDLAGDAGAVERLLEARPVVSGDGLATLLAMLGDRACQVPAPAGAVQLGPTCGDG